MLAFYMDHHVHAAVTRGLRRRGVDCLTLYEDGTNQDDDEAVLHRATQLERVLISQDRDLLIIACRWQRMGIQFSGLAWSEQNGISIGQAVNDIEMIAQIMTAEEMKNGVVFLPL